MLSLALPSSRDFFFFFFGDGHLRSHDEALVACERLRLETKVDQGEVHFVKARGEQSDISKKSVNGRPAEVQVFLENISVCGACKL